MLLQEHIKVTSIKETMEKNKPIITENTAKTNEASTDINNAENQTNTITIEYSEETKSEEKINPEIEPANEKNIVYVSLQDCWAEAIKESSTGNTMIAEELLLKQIPVDNEEHIITIEVPNLVGEREVKQIMPTLTKCLNQKTGILYTFDITIVKTVQQKQVDKNNPDEKFIHLCNENPVLMEFKKRLNLSIS